MSFVGVVAALEMERSWVRNADSELSIEVSGAGFYRAESAARRLVDLGAAALVSWGVAGGLDPELEPGTVVLPETVTDPDGSTWHTDRSWTDRLANRIKNEVTISGASLLHVREVISAPETKLELHRRFKAGAVDMESAAVAGVASETGVPWIAVRAILDSADQKVPSSVMTACDKHGRLQKSAVLGFVFRPHQWFGLISLARAQAKAGQSMRHVWSLTKPDLVFTEGES